MLTFLQRQQSQKLVELPNIYNHYKCSSKSRAERAHQLQKPTTRISKGKWTMTMDDLRFLHEVSFAAGIIPLLFLSK